MLKEIIEKWNNTLVGIRIAYTSEIVCLQAVCRLNTTASTMTN
jgi:hypothetical protein